MRSNFKRFEIQNRSRFLHTSWTMMEKTHFFCSYRSRMNNSFAAFNEKDTNDAEKKTPDYSKKPDDVGHQAQPMKTVNVCGFY